MYVYFIAVILTVEFLSTQWYSCLRLRCLSDDLPLYIPSDIPDIDVLAKAVHIDNNNTVTTITHICTYITVGPFFRSYIHTHICTNILWWNQHKFIYGTNKDF